MTRVNAYNLSLDGDVQLSEHFRLSEFRCRDGSDVVFIAPKLVLLLQQIRDWAGAPVTVTSGYRTYAYNREIRGAERSQHCLGTAADIVVQGKTPAQVAAFAAQHMTRSGGIGIYGTFTHVDVRAMKARWTG